MNKRIKKSVIAIGLASFTTAAILFGGCTSTSEKEKAANEATEKLIEAKNELELARQDYVEKLAAFKLESDNKLTENEKAIADLKVEINKKSKKVKADMEAQLATLELKNQLMKEKIRDYNDESTDKWEAFKLEFNRDMDNLGQALKDLTENNTK